MVDRIINEEIEEKIVNMGALGYPVAKMANVLGWPVEHVAELAKDKTSQFSKLLERGSDMADYLLDKKLFEMAKAGDLKAMQKYEFKKSQLLKASQA
jgi:hypothetical protein